MATADEYAAWIVANRDKKGTHEFNIVAQAYQQAKGDAQPAKPRIGAEDQKMIDEFRVGSGSDQFFAGAGKAVVDTWRGIKQLTGNMSEAEVDETKRLDAPLMGTGMGITGNVAGNLAMLVGPGAAVGAAGKVAQAPRLVNAARSMVLPTTIKGGAGIGAALGALQPVGEDDSRASNMLLSGAGGALGVAVPKAMGRMVSPQVSPEVAQLMREGVTPTPGQILGGAAKVAEEKATSVPFVGDAIAGAQRRAVEDFNRAAYNRVLGPIGQGAGKMPVGNEGVAAVGDEVSKAYNKLLPTLTAELDRPLAVEIAETTQRLAAELPVDRAKQFNTILDRYVMRRFGEDGKMSGEIFKKAESDISRLARQFSGSAEDEVRQMGYALSDLNASMRQMLERSNPGKAPELRAINEAWANLVRVEGAAGRVGSKEGVFTPEGLRGAVKGADKSVRHRAFARGEALMQDLADRGTNVLGGKYPDSGTAGRGAQIAAVAGAVHSPHILAALMAGSGLYTKSGQSALAALLTKRPDYAPLLADILKKQSLAAPGVAGLLALSQ